MNNETLNKVLKGIDDFFKDPENVKDFKKYLKEELDKPCYTHLHCMEPCQYRMPEDCDMGTIMWCSRYKEGQEDLCDKECGKRWSYELSIHRPDKEELENGN